MASIIGITSLEEKIKLFEKTQKYIEAFHCIEQIIEKMRSDPKIKPENINSYLTKKIQEYCKIASDLSKKGNIKEGLELLERGERLIKSTGNASNSIQKAQILLLNTMGTLEKDSKCLTASLVNFNKAIEIIDSSGLCENKAITF